ncbi:MAG: hypothetical protein AAF196_01205 [Planctomycetota bacterium]
MSRFRSLCVASLLATAVSAQTTGTVTSTNGESFDYTRLSIPCAPLQPTTVRIGNNIFIRTLEFSAIAPAGSGFALSVVCLSLPSTTVTPLVALGIPTQTGCAFGMDLGTLIAPATSFTFEPVFQSGIAFSTLGENFWPIGLTLQIQTVFRVVEPDELWTGDAFTITRNS